MFERVLSYRTAESADEDQQKTALTESSIAHALMNSIFPFSRYIGVPNVDHGLLPWEVDLAVLSVSSYLYEVEIKTSLADLRRDAVKEKHQPDKLLWHRDLLRGFWYAMPAAVWEKVSAAPPIPGHAGVIVVNVEGEKIRPRVIHQAQPNKCARKLTEVEKFTLLRLGIMRYWSRRYRP